LRRATLIAVLSKQGRGQPEKLKSTRIQIESNRQRTEVATWPGNKVNKQCGMDLRTLLIKCKRGHLQAV